MFEEVQQTNKAETILRQLTVNEVIGDMTARMMRVLGAAYVPSYVAPVPSEAAATSASATSSLSSSSERGEDASAAEAVSALSLEESVGGEEEDA